jgi:hypothetical protein
MKKSVRELRAMAETAIHVLASELGDIQFKRDLRRGLSEADDDLAGWLKLVQVNAAGRKGQRGSGGMPALMFFAGSAGSAMSSVSPYIVAGSVIVAGLYASGVFTSLVRRLVENYQRGGVARATKPLPETILAVLSAA